MTNDQMLYFILADFGKLGRAWVERDTDNVGRKATVAQIESGEWEKVIQVIECNPAEHTSRDVTEDIAWQVSSLWADRGEPLLDWQRDFIENHLGFEAANAFRQEAA